MRLVISILPFSGDSLQIHGIDELVSAGLDCSNPSRKTRRGRRATRGGRPRHPTRGLLQPTLQRQELLQLQHPSIGSGDGFDLIDTSGTALTRLPEAARSGILSGEVGLDCILIAWRE